MSLLERVRIVFLGDENTGKTFFCNKIKNDKLDLHNYYIPTIGVDFLTYIFTYKIKNNNKSNLYNINIWDIAGNPKFLPITKKYLYKNNFFVFFCDATNIESFKSLNKWLDLIREENTFDIKIFCTIICTKIDKITTDVIVNNFTIDEYLYNFSEQFHDDNLQNGKIFFIDKNTNSKKIIDEITTDYLHFIQFYKNNTQITKYKHTKSKWQKFKSIFKFNIF